MARPRVDFGVSKASRLRAVDRKTLCERMERQQREYERGLRMTSLCVCGQLEGTYYQDSRQRPSKDFELSFCLRPLLDMRILFSVCDKNFLKEADVDLASLYEEAGMSILTARV